MAVHNLKKYIPKKAFVVRILKIGIPSGIENGMFQIGKIVVVSMVAVVRRKERNPFHTFLPSKSK